ncbi:MAG: hypothetical protein IPM29_31810 [Planctomycetes bacterium]|nr:hypothetical protein [Planctomycetota bacterium]
MPTVSSAVPLLVAVLAATTVELRAQDAIPPGVSPFGAVHVDRPRADEPTVWVRGDRYKASIDGAACTFVPFLGAAAERDFPLRLAVQSVRVGSAKLDLAPRSVDVDGNRVTVWRADFAEVYDAGLDHLEQSFRFDRLPAARGELEIVLTATSELVGETAGDDVSFRGPQAEISYRELVVFDAGGRRRELPIRLEDGRLHLRVGADFVAEARLPLVVDPLLGTRIIATLADQRMNPDVAYNAGVDEYLVVWNVPFSATDWDVAAVRTDSSFNPIGAPFWIDYTTASWVGPRVACKLREGMSIVVAQVNSGGVSPYWISGRRYEAVGSYRFLHPQFDIERQTMSLGLPGDSFRPDIGADPRQGIGPAYFTVVYEYHPIGGNGDIVARHLQADGSWVFGAVSAINVGPYDDQAPSVTRSAGNGRFGIAWHQYGAGGAGNIVAAVIDMNGLQRVAPFFVDSSNDDDTRARISTPAQLPGSNRFTFLVTWQRNFDPFSNVGRLHCAAITDDPNAVLINRWDLSGVLGVPSNRMAYEPTVDSDGLRFVVAHTEVQNALPGQGRNDLFVSTVAIDGTQLLAHEARVPLWNTGPSAFSPAMVSHFGASLANSRTYGIVSGTSAISVVGYVYSGRQSGAPWRVRAGGCGGLPIGYSGFPSFGDSFSIAVGGSDPLRGLLLGNPLSMVPIGVCPSCLIGVANAVTVATPYSSQVPYLPVLVGLTLSAQGFSAGAGPCLGTIKLSDAVDFTLR